MNPYLLFVNVSQSPPGVRVGRGVCGGGWAVPVGVGDSGGTTAVGVDDGERSGVGVFPWIVR